MKKLDISMSLLPDTLLSNNERIRRDDSAEYIEKEQIRRIEAGEIYYLRSIIASDNEERFVAFYDNEKGVAFSVTCDVKKIKAKL